jgi:PAS domain S-box-containing protein
MICACLMVLCATVADAEPRHVVLLQSFERGNIVLDDFTSTLRKLMGERSPEPVTFMEFIVSPAGFQAIPEQAMLEFLRSSYANRPKPDLVITTGGPAAMFARRNRKELFPDVPLLYGAVDQRFMKSGTFEERDTAVAVANSPTSVVNDILQLFPDTRRVFVVLGTGVHGRFWREEFEREAEGFRGRVKFEWPDEMSYSMMLDYASRLPPQSAIFFVTLDVDSQGVTYPTSRVLQDLAAKANAPVFGAQSSELGLGLIGGRLMNIPQVSSTTADVALRILSGTPPALIATPIQQPGPPTFDWKQLDEWGVSESRLPPGSRVINKEPGVWARYKRAIVVTIVMLIVQSLLIAGLLVNRARRQRAEQSMRESEERFRLLANAAPVMIRMSDVDGGSTDFNIPWLAFTGRGPQDERGSGWLDGVHRDDLEACRKTHRQAMEQREPYRHEYRLRRADGEYRWILESGEPRFMPDGSFAGHIGSAIDVTDLKAARATLSNLNRRLINAQEQERSRVARELHDDVCQRMVTLAIDLHQFGETLPESAADARLRARDLYDEVRTLGQDVNAISHRLHSFKMGMLGLAPAAATFCEEIAARHRVTVDFEHADVPSQLPEGVAINLFRVLQESLSNAVKYSGASRYQVSLRANADGLQLVVADDGRGFDVAAAMKTSGLGLLSMQERLRLVNGDVAIESRPGSGTRVRASVPWQEAPVTVQAFSLR